MPSHAILLLTALLSFGLTAAAYHRGRAWLCLAAAAAYWAQCVWLGMEVIQPEMPIVFGLVTALGVGVPCVCLALFGLDVWLGAFTLDMTYALAFAWLLSPLPWLADALALAMGGPGA